MSTYRPITDVWLLARSKVKYYGAYPSGFLGRARALLGVGPDDPVLHVCSGMVRSYPWAGLGANDKTLDAASTLGPDFLLDVVDEPILRTGTWRAILADPPYTSEDAVHYPSGAAYPEPGPLLANCLDAVHVGGRVGMLHIVAPRPPKGTKFVACVGVFCGYGNQMRVFSVYERTA